MNKRRLIVGGMFVLTALSLVTPPARANVHTGVIRETAVLPFVLKTVILSRKNSLRIANRLRDQFVVVGIPPAGGESEDRVQPYRKH